MLEGFMRQSGGTIRVSSELNVGTTFKLYFAAAPDTQTKGRRTSERMPNEDGGTRATILLVEDNAEVLNAYRMTLLKYGYRVLEATSGDAAYQMFLDEPDIDLVLTDIVMPGELQGTTLATALRKLRPDLPIVFMSGHASEATVHGNEIRPQDVRLMKPIRREDLLHTVNKALSLSGKNQA
jgi:CheY-like chemotaxis protein